MKIGIIGGKTLLDIAFLNKLSNEISHVDLECYGDSGEISFGSKRIKIQDIKKINLNKFDIIINQSNEHRFILNMVKTNNEKSNKKIVYINTIEGDLTINDIPNTNTNNQLIKLPNFSLEPIVKLFSKIDSSNIVLTINKPIAELGKEAMNQFYHEIKESQIRIVQHNEKDHSEALAFNVSFPQSKIASIENLIDGKNQVKPQDSEEEIEIKEQLSLFINSNILLNICRVPVNKGSSIIAVFEPKKHITEKELIQNLESIGLIYAQRDFSTILTENDPCIYFTKIKKTEKNFSIIFMFDSIQLYTTNLLNILFKLVSKKN